MDLLIQSTLGILQGLLPEGAIAFLNHNLLDPSSPFQHLKRAVVSLLASLLAQLWPIVAPVVERITNALAASPDLVVLAFFLALVVAVFQILAFVQRIMMFWTRLAFRAVFWAAVVGLAAMVWQRGLEASVRDAVVVGSKVMGFAAGVKDVFWSEYGRYEAQERASRMGAPPRQPRRGW